MGGKLFVALVAIAASVAAQPAQAPRQLTIRGLIYDGLPPERFQNDIEVTVMFTRDLDKYCGTPPEGKHWGGCRRGVKLYLMNPCHRSGHYPRLACHEIGHSNGWSRYHEY